MEGDAHYRPARNRGSMAQSRIQTVLDHAVQSAQTSGGGRRISKEIRELIFQMVAQNPTWGAPRIHGELLMLGFEVSETTVSRWMRRAPRHPEPAQRDRKSVV